MTEDLGGDAVRYEGDHPVAVGEVRWGSEEGPPPTYDLSDERNTPQ